jgi:hypothetical protein
MMQRFSIRGRLFVGVLGAVTVCATVSAVATHQAFERVLLDINESHFRFVVNDVRTSITNLTALGLPLSALHRSQDIIDKIHSRDPEVGSIVIFGALGEILFSTDLGEIGSSVSPEWLDNAKAGAEAGADGEQVRSIRKTVAVAPLANSFGDFTGGVALRLGATGLPLQLEEGALLLAGLAIAGLLLAAFGAWFGVRAGFGPLADGLRQGANHMEALVNGSQDAKPLTLPPWLRPAFERYAARVRRTLKLLDRATATAARVDEHR